MRVHPTYFTLGMINQILINAFNYNNCNVDMLYIV
jgi:hypothetical protein